MAIRKYLKRAISSQFLGDIGSFLFGGYTGSGILGHGNLHVSPPQISTIGDLTSELPIGNDVTCIGSNGANWLVGFEDGYLYKFDGVNWTQLLAGINPNYIAEDIRWNGIYWLILFRFSNTNMLYKYDGVSLTFVGQLTNVRWRGLAWSPTLNYWLIVGDSYAAPSNGKAWTLSADLMTLTDISGTINWGSYRIYVAEWHENHFLLGGAPYANYGKLMKFDGTTATIIVDHSQGIGPSCGEFWAIRYGAPLSLLGTGGYPNPNMEKLFKWDGTNLSEIVYFDFRMRGIDHAEGLFLIVGTRVVSNYTTYYYPRLRLYRVSDEYIDFLTPPWGEGNRIRTVAYNPYVF